MGVIDSTLTISVTANSTSGGQGTDFSGWAGATLAFVNDQAGVALQYALDGVTWQTLAIGGTVTFTAAVPSLIRLRKTTADNFPVPLTVDVDVQGGGLTPAQIAWANALTAPVADPATWRFTSHGLRLKRTINGIATDFQITDLIPAPTVTYYVNPLTGSNANSGLTAPLALADLSVALAKVDVDQIIITGLTADYLALGVKGWNNTQPTRSVAIINRTGFRFISCDASATLPTWTVNGTFSNVYQSSAVTAVNGRSVTDVSKSFFVTYTDKTGATQTLTNQPKYFRTLKRVASLAAVSAEAGTYFHDGTQLQVRPHDDRVLTSTQTMLATSDSNNGRFPSVNNCKIYAENIDFVGGFRSFLALMASTVTGTQLALNGCSFQGAGTSNGLSVEASSAVYLYRCGAYQNFVDGLNYHAGSLDAVTPANSPNVIEIECASFGNGATGSAGISDNASTAHEFCNVIALNCAYPNSDDSPVVDINDVQRWSLGCHIGPATSVGVGRPNVKAANNAKHWVDSCYLPAGVNGDLVSAETANASFIYTFNSGNLTNAAGSLGTVRAYLG